LNVRGVGGNSKLLVLKRVIESGKPKPAYTRDYGLCRKS